MTKLSKNISNNPLEKENIKKISLNLDKKTIELIDEVKDLTKSTRTVVILALVHHGLSPLLANLKETWTKMKSDKKHKKNIEELLKNLKKIEKKKV